METQCTVVEGFTFDNSSGMLLCKVKNSHCLILSKQLLLFGVCKAVCEE